MKKNNVNAPDRREGGFTLAELLIVVAIIAVLAAIAIPVFGQALEKAGAATCQANRRSLRSELAVAYMTGSATSEADVNKLFNESLATYTCPAHGTWKLTYDAKTGQTAIACSKHSSASMGDLGEKDSAGKPSANVTVFFNTLLDKFKSNTKTNSDQASDEVKSALAAELKNAIGFDLNAAAGSWYFDSTSTDYRRFYWIENDSWASLFEGGKSSVTLPMMKLTQRGNYTVYNMTVSKGADNQLSFSEGKMLSPDIPAEQTYENALKIYNDALKSQG